MTAVAILETMRKHQKRIGRYMREVVFYHPSPPRWSTPNEIVEETESYRLRSFGGAGGKRPAVLVVPPEVNRSAIIDLAPENSLPRVLLAGGFGRVASMDWLQPGPAQAERDIDDSITDIISAALKLGPPVHLVGLCQGGWESAIVAALRPELVLTLTLVAAPIDFSAGEGQVKWLSRLMPMAAYRTLVQLGGGIMRGEFISAGFDMLQPFERGFLNPLAAWNRIDDGRWLGRYHRLQNWYRTPKDLAGKAYLRIVEQLFKQNRLARGTLEVLGRRVDLRRITCPLALVAGERDHITPPPQLWAAEKLVS
ncbi:MAG: alpha/beta fold hydrolase, partial [Deltaproteobacteria bacterium]